MTDSMATEATDSFQHGADVIRTQDIEAAVQRIAVRLVAERHRLNELDAALGDGDTGVTAGKIAVALETYLQANPAASQPDLGKWLAQMGMAVNRAAPSTLGTLTATALMRMGKAAMGQVDLDAPTLVLLLEAANSGIQERGKARPGDKTIVDALHPATEAFAEAVGRGARLQQAGQAMLEAARQGRDAAIPLQGKLGRAQWLGERTAGNADPGTVMLVAVIEAILTSN
jgi:phosphoenolpyruvate---glycerone phosphotransferase subunit DhaL